MKIGGAFLATAMFGLQSIPLLAQAESPAPRTTTTDPAAQLVIEVSRLRFAFAASSDTALQGLSGPERAVLTERLGLGDSTTRSQWENVIAMSTQFLRLEGDAAETLWWNPMVDGGVALRWRRDAGGWRVVDAVPYLGEALRGAPMEIGTNFLTGLRRIAVATRASFRSGGAARLFTLPAPFRPVLDRAAGADRSFAVSINGMAPVGDRLAAAEELLIRAGPIGPLGLVHYLAAMPTEARRMLSPLRRFADASGESIVWGSAGSPDSLLVLQYPNDPSVIMPRMVLAVNLIVREGEQP